MLISMVRSIIRLVLCAALLLNIFGPSAYASPSGPQTRILIPSVDEQALQEKTLFIPFSKLAPHRLTSNVFKAIGQVKKHPVFALAAVSGIVLPFFSPKLIKWNWSFDVDFLLIPFRLHIS